MNLITKSKCRVHTAFYHKLRFAYTFYLMVAVHSRRLFTFLPNFCTLFLLCIFVRTFFPLISSYNALQNTILSTKPYKSFSVRTLRTKPDVDATKYTVKHHTNIQAHENFRTKMLCSKNMYKRTRYSATSNFCRTNSIAQKAAGIFCLPQHNPAAHGLIHNIQSVNTPQQPSRKIAVYYTFQEHSKTKPMQALHSRSCNSKSAL